MDAKQFPTLPGASFVHGKDRGVALTTSLVLLAVLTLLGTGAMVTSLTDIQIGTNYKTSTQAFYDAEAGVHYTLARLPDAISSGTLTLNGATATETYTVAPPSGFAFDPITTFTRVGTTGRDYRFQARGHAGRATSTIEVVFRAGSGWSPPYGIFGDTQVTLGRGSAYFSYDSRTTQNPVPPSLPLPPGGDMDVGSNGNVTLDETVTITGGVNLGKDSSGNPGTYTVNPSPPNQNPTVTGGWPPHTTLRECPDPLDANGNSVCMAEGLATTVHDDITAASTSNNNTTASPPISRNVINLSGGGSMTLTAGTYYLSSITLDSGSTLNIDTSSGEVKIYLVGSLDAKSGSTINYTSPTAKPTDFTLYSDATAPITFTHTGDFKGTIYAPFASVSMNNHAGLFGTPVASGLIWAGQVTMGDLGQFYFDVAVKDKFLSNAISIISWKEVRN